MIIFIGVLFIILIISYKIVSFKLNDVTEIYTHVFTLMKHFSQTAYNKVYEDQILAYASEGLKEIPETELETIKRNYIKLCFELMGPQITTKLVKFFGTRRILINNLLIVFENNYKTENLKNIFKSNEG